ncbi:hypothetical protein BER93_01030 [Xanthomonas fragariae]|nr:hypothetical protein BER92_01040 [Xanthomonas fragariae]AOD16964.1 hypothetical protein BER93_01030 [Xanthomonas fragariae]ENZ94995.1 IS1478 transposase [Xanthomonas fragariae LMG 25863]
MPGLNKGQDANATATALDQTMPDSGTGDRTSLRRCRRKGGQGNALQVLGCAAGYNLRWLMRWIAFLRAWIRGMGWPSLSTVHRSPLPIGA